MRIYHPVKLWMPRPVDTHNPAAIALKMSSSDSHLVVDTKIAIFICLKNEKANRIGTDLTPCLFRRSLDSGADMMRLRR
jgi:hypothetical protein